MSPEKLDQQDFEKIFIQAQEKFNFYLLPNASDLGISKPDQSRLIQRAKDALSQGFTIEFISLKLQYIEFFLRIYNVVKSKKGKVFSKDDKSTFGIIVNNCKQLGFDTQLVSKLEDFNQNRVDAIHKFLLGETSEEELEKVAIQYSKLGEDIKNYVISQLGKQIKSSKDLPNTKGAMVFQIKKL